MNIKKIDRLLIDENYIKNIELENLQDPEDTESEAKRKIKNIEKAKTDLARQYTREINLRKSKIEEEMIEAGTMKPGVSSLTEQLAKIELEEHIFNYKFIISGMEISTPTRSGERKGNPDYKYLSQMRDQVRILRKELGLTPHGNKLTTKDFSDVQFNSTIESIRELHRWREEAENEEISKE